MNLKSHFVTIKENKFHVVESEKGDIPILMAHGLAANWECIRPIAENLPDFTRPIMYDAKAHGLTDAPNTGYSRKEMANDMYSISKKLNLNRPVLFGHSLGANTAALASNMFDDLRGLVLEDPAGRKVNNQSSEKRNKELKESFRRWRTSSHKDIMKEYTRTPNFKDELATAGKQLRPEALKIDKRGYKYVNELLPSQPPETLILRPDPNKVNYPVKPSKDVHDNVQIQNVRDTTHSVFRDNPKKFIELFDSFLQSKIK